jgi:hypothetical protein
VPAPGFAFFFLAAAVDFQAGAAAETRRGEVPVELDAPSHPATVSVITPAVGVALNDREGTLQLRYAPRLSWFQIHDNSPRQKVAQPLVLHQVELTSTWRSERGVVYSLRGSDTTGDADYSALTTVFGRRQSQIPDVTGFTYLVGALGSSARIQADWQLDTVLEVFHRSTLTGAAPRTVEPPYDPTAPPPPPPEPAPAGGVYGFPDDNGVTFTPTLLHAFDKTTALEMRSALGYVWVANGLKQGTFGPTVGLRHNFARQGSWRMAAGMVLSHTFSFPTRNDTSLAGVAGAERTSVSPLAELSLTAPLYTSRGWMVSTTLGAATSYYFDPVLAVSGTVGTGTFGLTMAFPPYWTTGLEAYFSTSLRDRPLPITPEPDETVASASLPIRYRVTRTVNVEVGGRWSERAAHLKAADFTWRHREFWIYGAITGTFDTARPAVASMASTSVLGATPGELPRSESTIVAGRVDAVPADLRPQSALSQRPPSPTDPAAGAAAGRPGTIAQPPGTVTPPATETVPAAPTTAPITTPLAP